MSLRRAVWYLLTGAVAAACGILLGHLVSPRLSGALSVMVAALFITPLMRYLFGVHRDLSWQAAGNPAAAARAARSLVVNLLVVIFGMACLILAYWHQVGANAAGSFFALQMAGLAGETLSFSGANVSPLTTLIFAEVFYYLAAFALAAVLKEGGVALIVSWTGHLWGVAVALAWHGTARIGTTATSFLVILTVALVLSTAALLVTGSIGLFLSRGAMKYGIMSTEFRRIARTCLLLFGAIAVLGMLGLFVKLTARIWLVVNDLTAFLASGF